MTFLAISQYFFHKQVELASSKCDGRNNQGKNWQYNAQKVEAFVSFFVCQTVNAKYQARNSQFDSCQCKKKHERRIWDDSLNVYFFGSINLFQNDSRKKCGCDCIYAQQVSDKSKKKTFHKIPHKEKSTILTPSAKKPQVLINLRLKTLKISCRK